MMANLDRGLTHTHTQNMVILLGSELSFGTQSVLRSLRKQINNMLLLIVEAKNNYHVEAPILLQKNNKLHIMKNLIQFFSFILCLFKNCFIKCYFLKCIRERFNNSF